MIAMTVISLLIVEVTQQRLLTFLKVHSGNVEAHDEGSTTAFLMRDLYAVFYVIDHPILLKRLELYFSIKENALIWVTLYLAN